MRKLFITLAACFMLISISACSEHGHDDGSHSHDGAPDHHNSIN